MRCGRENVKVVRDFFGGKFHGRPLKGEEDNVKAVNVFGGTCEDVNCTELA